MNAHILTGEASSTLIAAIYPDSLTAMQAARQLAGSVRFADWQLSVVHPGDPMMINKAEPERSGIWRTLIRSHAWLGLAGFTIGLAAGGLMIGMNWFGASSTPGTVLATLSVFTAMAGLMTAGLISLRPDHGHVLTHLREALDKGKWAVIARPANADQTKATLNALHASGGLVLRSL
jgi:hypothetical protein